MPPLTPLPAAHTTISTPLSHPPTSLPQTPKTLPPRPDASLIQRPDSSIEHGLKPVRSSRSVGRRSPRKGRVGHGGVSPSPRVRDRPPHESLLPSTSGQSITTSSSTESVASRNARPPSPLPQPPPRPTHPPTTTTQYPPAPFLAHSPAIPPTQATNQGGITNPKVIHLLGMIRSKPEYQPHPQLSGNTAATEAAEVRAGEAGSMRYQEKGLDSRETEKEQGVIGKKRSRSRENTPTVLPTLGPSKRETTTPNRETKKQRRSTTPPPPVVPLVQKPTHRPSSSSTKTPTLRMDLPPPLRMDLPSSHSRPTSDLYPPKAVAAPGKWGKSEMPLGPAEVAYESFRSMRWSTSRRPEVGRGARAGRERSVRKGEEKEDRREKKDVKRSEEEREDEGEKKNRRLRELIELKKGEAMEGVVEGSLGLDQAEPMDYEDSITPSAGSGSRVSPMIDSQPDGLKASTSFNPTGEDIDMLLQEVAMDLEGYDEVVPMDVETETETGSGMGRGENDLMSARAKVVAALERRKGLEASVEVKPVEKMAVEKPVSTQNPTFLKPEPLPRPSFPTPAQTAQSLRRLHHLRKHSSPLLDEGEIRAKELPPDIDPTRTAVMWNWAKILGRRDWVLYFSQYGEVKYLDMVTAHQQLRTSSRLLIYVHFTEPWMLDNLLSKCLPNNHTVPKYLEPLSEIFPGVADKFKAWKQPYITLVRAQKGVYLPDGLFEARDKALYVARDSDMERREWDEKMKREDRREKGESVLRMDEEVERMGVDSGWSDVKHQGKDTQSEAFSKSKSTAVNVMAKTESAVSSTTKPFITPPFEQIKAIKPDAEEIPTQRSKTQIMVKGDEKEKMVVPVMPRAMRAMKGMELGEMYSDSLIASVPSKTLLIVDNIPSWVDDLILARLLASEGIEFTDIRITHSSSSTSTTPGGFVRRFGFVETANEEQQREGMRRLEGYRIGRDVLEVQRGMGVGPIGP